MENEAGNYSDNFLFQRTHKGPFPWAQEEELNKDSCFTQHLVPPSLHLAEEFILATILKLFHRETCLSYIYPA